MTRNDPIPGIDLADARLYATTDTDALFADLRREHPVFWHGPKSTEGFWSVTRHSDAVRVYRDPAAFSAEHGMTIDTVHGGPDPAAGRMLEVTDPPRHTRLRKVIGSLFTAGAVAALEPEIGRVVRRLLTEVRDADEPFDFVARVSSRMPARIAGVLLGLPDEDMDWIAEKTSQVFLSGSVPQVPGGPSPRAVAEQANADLLGYFAKLIQRRQQSGQGGGLIRQLLSESVNGESLTLPEVMVNSLNLAIAGTQTTRNTMAGALSALLRFPASYQALRDEPELIPSAVEEAVRWATPVRHVARTTIRDVEIGGRSIRAGEPVVVWAYSANRDEEVFRMPHVFDVRRHPNPHLGFARGTHSCLGAALARLQLRVAIRTLTELFAGGEPAGPPVRTLSNFLAAYQELPVRLRAAEGSPPGCPATAEHAVPSTTGAQP
ncbi:cytochrome P450 [Streptomyces sp. NPDC006692]|uniref:cytochrome P450 n=1 Tax=Streptomyces sp. NPDC006692 TaxID=3364758 RepID=UPI0036A3D319